MILVTQSSMPSYEEYCEQIKDIWESQNINVDVRTLTVEEAGAVVL